MDLPTIGVGGATLLAAYKAVRRYGPRAWRRIRRLLLVDAEERRADAATERILNDGELDYFRQAFHLAAENGATPAQRNDLVDELIARVKAKRRELDAEGKEDHAVILAVGVALDPDTGEERATTIVTSSAPPCPAVNASSRSLPPPVFGAASDSGLNPSENQVPLPSVPCLRMGGSGRSRRGRRSKSRSQRR
jgi:hypothetical protein